MPIVSLMNAISFIISLIAAINLYFAYRKTGNKQVKIFFNCIGSICIFFLLIASPGTMVQDAFWAGFFNALAFPVLLVSGMFFTIIVLNLFYLERVKRAYIAMIILAIIAVFTLRMLAPIPLSEVKTNGFTFWVRADNAYIRASSMLSGVIVFLSVVGGGLTFLFYGLKKGKDRYILKRSILIGGGAILLSFSSVVSFVLGATPNPFTLALASILASVGVLTMFFGVLLKKNNPI